MTKTPSGWERRIAAAMGATALAVLATAPVMAQTTTSTNATQPRVTNLGPTQGPGVVTAPAPGANTSLPPGTTISRPPYQSSIGLPYGANTPAPYAYGAARPSTLAPTLPTTKGAAKGQQPVVPGPTQGQGTDEQQGVAPSDAAAAGTPVPVDPRLGLPRRMTNAPGYVQPPIKAQPDYKPGDPYARSTGSPALPQPFGVSPYRVPYSIDASGNYFSPPGSFSQNGVLTPNATYRGKVDNQGVVYDQYGNRRGTLK